MFTWLITDLNYNCQHFDMFGLGGGQSHRVALFNISIMISFIYLTVSFLLSFFFCLFVCCLFFWLFFCLSVCLSVGLSRSVCHLSVFLLVKHSDNPCCKNHVSEIFLSYLSQLEMLQNFLSVFWSEFSKYTFSVSIHISLTQHSLISSDKLT